MFHILKCIIEICKVMDTLIVSSFSLFHWLKSNLFCVKSHKKNKLHRIGPITTFVNK